MNLSKHASEIRKFNSIAGNYQFNGTLLECWQMIKRQMAVHAEEFNETVEALSVEDAQELLDGCCDQFVTLTGLMQMLEGLNFKMDDALEAVCSNNSQKYTTSYSYASISKEHLEKNDPNYQYYICDSVYEGETYYTVKDQNGKIRKLKSHQRPEIDKYVPQEFK